MKRSVALSALLIWLLSLWGCAAEKVPVPETTPATQATIVPTEPAPTEPEPVREMSFNWGTIRDGIYVMDTSEYDFAFGEVLLDIDLTENVFTLKCFDGKVVSGTIDFEENGMICRYPGGHMKFTTHLQDGVECLRYYDSEYGHAAYDQLMFCPQITSNLDAYFIYAENRKDEILADPELDVIDNYKNLYSEGFVFDSQASVTNSQGFEDRCALTFWHFPLQQKWTFQTFSQSKEVTAQEQPDASIVFTQGGAQWHFHREGDALVFDGGSVLIAGNAAVDKQYQVEMDVPQGAVFSGYHNNYLYDGLYIIPGPTLDEAYAGIQIDTENQWIKIHCYDGNVLEGTYTFLDDIHLYCNFEVPDYVGTRTTYISLTPSGHALGVSNGWMLNIGPGGMGDRFYFFPVKGVHPPAN